MRACSVSGVSPGEHRHGLLAQHGPGVDALVDEVNRRACLGDAGSERVLDGVSSGKRGEQRRVHVDDSSREAGEEDRSQQVHVPRADDEPDPVPASQSAIAASRASRSA